MGHYTAVYYGLAHAAGFVRVPTFKCCLCSLEVSVHLFQVGCAPTAPERRNQLVAIDLVQHFMFLHLKGGISAQGA